MDLFARLVSGQVAEIIPAVIDVEGRSVPLAERYHPDFIASLVPYDQDSQPEPGGESIPQAQQMQAMDDMLENLLDDIARSQGFRNMDRAVSYRGDPNPVTDAKAQTLFLYRSEFWTRCDEHKALILAGNAEIPTLEEAIALLPVFTPPPVEEEPEQPADDAPAE